MHFLPKANPLYENIQARKVSLPDVLEKLGKGGFTGYLSHEAANFEAYCIFAKGKMICAVATEGSREKTGFEAIAYMFDRIFAIGGEVNVYRMTADTAMCAHALVAGTKIINGDEVRQVDVKGMLTGLKNQTVNGVVHFFTKNRYSMMFYKEGQPIGFYHDGARAIESSPDETRKVAALPGARVEVCSTKPVEELMHYDLLQMVNLPKLWEGAALRNKEVKSKPVAEPQSMPVVADEKKLAELVEDLKEVALAYYSREGSEFVMKRLNEAGGPVILSDSVKKDEFLARLEIDARAIDSNARIDEMLDLMRSEIAGRLAV